jgi:hypothetical protein
MAMSQRDKGQKRLSEADLSRRRAIAAPAVPREKVVETTERVTRQAPRPASGRGRSARQALLDQLAGRGSLRQAILLSEILGPPKALR